MRKYKQNKQKPIPGSDCKLWHLTFIDAKNREIISGGASLMNSPRHNVKDSNTDIQKVTIC